jgi:DNA-binding MarR family transcriptional regulator
MPNKREMLAPREVAAWQGLLRVSGKVLRALDAALEEHHRLSVAGFDVLITLFNARDGRLRMTELAREVVLSPSGLTHLVDRLERRELLRREQDPDDRRGSLAVLTQTGLELLDSARQTHNEVVREKFLRHLDRAEVDALSQIWTNVLIDPYGRVEP